MTPNVVVIIQARMGSQRFPGKISQSVVANPSPVVPSSVLHYVNSRAVAAGYPTYVAMPDNDKNRMACRLTAAMPFFWDGPENDVLGRYAACAKLYKADVVVRITADCPLVDPVAIQGQVKRLLDTGAMYVSNIYPVRQVPSGFDVEVFTATALYVADALATDPYDREHVTPWMQRMFSAWKVDVMMPHLSVDTPEDLERVRTVLTRFP